MSSVELGSERDYRTDDVFHPKGSSLRIRLLLIDIKAFRFHQLENAKLQPSQVAYEVEFIQTKAAFDIESLLPAQVNR